jgi:hypothetical protein
MMKNRWSGIVFGAVAERKDLAAKNSEQAIKKQVDIPTNRMSLH